MNRWITSLLLVLLAACHSGASRTEEIQQASTDDCVPGGNFDHAKLPPLPLWNGTRPLAGPGQLFLDVADWRVNGQGYHVAVLVDPGKGEIVWGATVPDSKLGAFRSGPPGLHPSIGDCCRPPPCNCRGCCGDWMAPILLEAGMRYIVVPDNAVAATPAGG